MDALFRIVFTVGALVCVAYAVAVGLRSKGKTGGLLRLLASPRVLAVGLSLGIGGLVVDYLWGLFFLPF